MPRASVSAGGAPSREPLAAARMQPEPRPTSRDVLTTASSHGFAWSASPSVRGSPTWRGSAAYDSPRVCGPLAPVQRRRCLAWQIAPSRLAARHRRRQAELSGSRQRSACARPASAPAGASRPGRISALEEAGAARRSAIDAPSASLVAPSHPTAARRRGAGLEVAQRRAERCEAGGVPGDQPAPGAAPSTAASPSGDASTASSTANAAASPTTACDIVERDLAACRGIEAELLDLARGSPGGRRRSSALERRAGVGAIARPALRSPRRSCGRGRASDRRSRRSPRRVRSLSSRPAAARSSAARRPR